MRSDSRANRLWKDGFGVRKGEEKVRVPVGQGRGLQGLIGTTKTLCLSLCRDNEGQRHPPSECSLQNLLYDQSPIGSLSWRKSGKVYDHTVFLPHPEGKLRSWSPKDNHQPGSLLLDCPVISPVILTHSISPLRYSEHISPAQQVATLVARAPARVDLGDSLRF